MWRCIKYCCPCFFSDAYDEQNIKLGLLPNIRETSNNSDLYTVHKISSFGRNKSQDAHSATSSVCDESDLQSYQTSTMNSTKKCNLSDGENDFEVEVPPTPAPKQKGKWGKAVTKLHSRTNKKNKHDTMANISMMMMPPMIASTPELASTTKEDMVQNPDSNPVNCADDLGLLLSPISSVWFRSQSVQSICPPSEENESECDKSVNNERMNMARQYGLDASLYNCSKLSKSSEAIDRAWKSMGDIPTHERFIELAYGTVAFTAQYKDKKFIIHLVKLIGLAPKGKACLDYKTVVKLTILPLEKQVKQSKLLPASANPEINQDFSFLAKDINNKILRISVFDMERQGKYNAVGHALFYLEDIKSSKKLQSYEMKLFPQSLPNVIPGCLFLSLEYNGNSKLLQVDIDQASKLQSSLSSGKCRLFVKIIYFRGSKKMKESESQPVLVQNSEVKFDFSESLKIDENHVKDCSLVIALKFKGMFHDKNVGRVIFGPYFYAEYGHKLTPWGRLFLKNEQIKYSFRMYL